MEIQNPPTEQVSGPKNFDYFVLKAQGLTDQDIAHGIVANNTDGIESNISFQTDPEKAFKSYIDNPFIPKEKKSEEIFKTEYQNQQQAYSEFKKNESSLRKINFKPVFPGVGVADPEIKALPEKYIPRPFGRFDATDIGPIPLPDPSFIEDVNGYKKRLAEDNAVAFQRGYYLDNTDGGKMKPLDSFVDKTTPFSWLGALWDDVGYPSLLGQALKYGLDKANIKFSDADNNKKLVLDKDEEGFPVFKVMDMSSYAKQSQIYEDFNDQKSLEQPWYNEFTGAIFNTAWNSLPSAAATIADMADTVTDIVTGDNKTSPFAEKMKAFAATEQYKRGITDEEAGLISLNGTPYMLGTVVGSLAQYFLGTKGLSMLGMTPKAAFLTTSWALGSQAADQVRQFGEERGIDRKELLPFMMGAWAAQALIEQSGGNYLFEKFITTQQGKEAFIAAQQASLKNMGLEAVLSTGPNNAFRSGIQWGKNMYKSVTGKETTGFFDSLQRAWDNAPIMIKTTSEETFEETAQQMSNNLMQVMHDYSYQNSPQFYDEEGIPKLKHIFDEVGENAWGGFLGGMIGGAFFPKAKLNEATIYHAVISGQYKNQRELLIDATNNGRWSADKTKNDQYGNILITKLDYINDAYNKSGLKKYYDSVISKSPNFNKETGDPQFAQMMMQMEEGNNADGIKQTKGYIKEWFEATEALRNHEALNPDSFEGGKDAWLTKGDELKKKVEYLNSDAAKFDNYMQLGFKFFAGKLAEKLDGQIATVEGFKEILNKQEEENIRTQWAETYAANQEMRKAANSWLSGSNPAKVNHFDTAFKYFTDPKNISSPEFMREAIAFADYVRNVGGLESGNAELDKINAAIESGVTQRINDIRQKYGINGDDSRVTRMVLGNELDENFNQVPLRVDQEGKAIPADAEDIDFIKAFELSGAPKYEYEPSGTPTPTDAEVRDILMNKFWYGEKIFVPSLGKEVTIYKAKDIKELMDEMEAKIDDDPSLVDIIPAIKSGLLHKRIRAFYNHNFKQNFTEDVQKALNMNDVNTLPADEYDDYYKNIQELSQRFDKFSEKYEHSYNDKSFKYSINYGVDHIGWSYHALVPIAESLDADKSTDKLKHLEDVKELQGILDQLKDQEKELRILYEAKIADLRNEDLITIQRKIQDAKMLVVKANSLTHRILNRFRDTTYLKQALMNASTKALVNYSENPTKENDIKASFPLMFNNQMINNERIVSNEKGILSPFDRSRAKAKTVLFISMMANHLNNLWRLDQKLFYELHKQINDKGDIALDDPEQEQILLQSFALFLTPKNLFNDGTPQEGLPISTTDNSLSLTSSPFAAHEQFLAITGTAGVGKTFISKWIAMMILQYNHNLGKAAKDIVIVAPKGEQLDNLKSIIQNAGAYLGIKTERVYAYDHTEFFGNKKQFDAAFTFIDEATRFTSIDANWKIRERVSGPVYLIGDTNQFSQFKDINGELQQLPLPLYNIEKTPVMFSSKRIADINLNYFNQQWLDLMNGNSITPFGQIGYSADKKSGVFARMDSADNREAQLIEFLYDINGQTANGVTYRKNTVMVVDDQQQLDHIIDQLGKLAAKENQKNPALKLDGSRNKLTNPADRKIYQLKDTFDKDGKPNADIAQGLERERVYVQFSDRRSVFAKSKVGDDAYNLWYTAVSRSKSYLDVVMPAAIQFTPVVSNDKNTKSVQEKLNVLYEKNKQSQISWYTTISTELAKSGKYDAVNSQSSNESRPTETVQSKPEVKSKAKAPTTAEEAEKEFTDTATNQQQQTILLFSLITSFGGPVESGSESDGEERTPINGKSQYELLNAEGNLVTFNNVHEYANGKIAIKFIDLNYLAQTDSTKARASHKTIVQNFISSSNQWIANPDMISNGVVRRLKKSQNGKYVIGYYLNPDNEFVKQSILHDAGNYTKEDLLIAYEYEPDTFNTAKSNKGGLAYYTDFISRNKAIAASATATDFINSTTVGNLSYPDYIRQQFAENPALAEKVIAYETGKISRWFEMIKGAKEAPVELLGQLRAPNLVFGETKSLGRFLNDKNFNVVTDKKDNLWFKHNTRGYYIGTPVFMYDADGMNNSFYDKDENKVTGFSKYGFEMGWYIPVSWNALEDQPSVLWHKVKSEKATFEDYKRLKTFIKRMGTAILQKKDKNGKAVESIDFDDVKNERFYKALNSRLFDYLLTSTKYFWAENTNGTWAIRDEWKDYVVPGTTSNKNGNNRTVFKFKAQENESVGTILKRVDAFADKIGKYAERFVDKGMTSSTPKLYGISTLLYVMDNIGAKDANLFTPFIGMTKTEKIMTWEQITKNIQDIKDQHASLNNDKFNAYNILESNLEDVKTNHFLINALPPAAASTTEEVIDKPVPDFKIKQDGDFMEQQDFEETKAFLNMLNPWMTVNGVQDLQTKEGVKLWGSIVSGARTFLGARFGAGTIYLDTDNGMATGGYFVAAHEFGHKVFNSLKPTVQETLISDARIIFKQQTGRDSTDRNNYDMVEWIMDYIARDLVVNKDKMSLAPKSFLAKAAGVLKSFINQLFTFLGMARRYTKLDQLVADIRDNKFRYDLLTYNNGAVNYMKKDILVDSSMISQVFGDHQTQQSTMKYVTQIILENSLFNAKSAKSSNLPETIARLSNHMVNIGSEEGNKIVNVPVTTFEGTTTVSKPVNELTVTDYTALLGEYFKNPAGDPQHRAYSYIVYHLGIDKALRVNMLSMMFPDQDIDRILSGSRKFFSYDDDVISDEDDNEEAPELELSNTTLDKHIDMSPTSTNSFMTLIMSQPTWSFDSSRPKLGDENVVITPISKSLRSIPVENIFNHIIRVLQQHEGLKDGLNISDFVASVLKSGRGLIAGVKTNASGEQETLYNKDKPMADAMNTLYARMYHIPEIDDNAFYVDDAITNVFGYSYMAHLKFNGRAIPLNKISEADMNKRQIEYAKIINSFESNLQRSFTDFNNMTFRRSNDGTITAENFRIGNQRNQNAYGRLSGQLKKLGEISNGVYGIREYIINRFKDTATYEWTGSKKMGTILDSVPEVRLSIFKETSKEAAVELIRRSPYYEVIKSKLGKKALLSQDAETKALNEWFEKNYKKTEDSDKRSKYYFEPGTDASPAGIYIAQGDNRQIVVQWSSKGGTFSNQIGSTAAKIKLVKGILNQLGVTNFSMDDQVLNIIMNNQTRNPIFKTRIQEALGLPKSKEHPEYQGMTNYDFDENRLATLLYKMVRATINPDPKEDFVTNDMLRQGLELEAIADFDEDTNEDLYETITDVDEQPINHPLVFQNDLHDLAALNTYVNSSTLNTYVLNEKNNRIYQVSWKAFADRVQSVLSSRQAVMNNDAFNYGRFNPLINGRIKLVGELSQTNVIRGTNYKKKGADEMNFSEAIYTEIEGLFLKQALNTKATLLGSEFSLYLQMPGDSSKVLSGKFNVGKDFKILNMERVDIGDGKYSHSIGINHAGNVNNFELKLKEVEARRIAETQFFDDALKFAFNNKSFDVALIEARQQFEKTGNYEAFDKFIAMHMAGLKSDDARNLVKERLLTFTRNKTSNVIGKGFTYSKSIQPNSHYHLVPNGSYFDIAMGNLVSTAFRQLQDGKLVVKDEMFGIKNRLEYEKNTQKLDKAGMLKDPKKANLEKSFFIINHLLNNKLNEQLNRLSDTKTRYYKYAKKYYSFGKDLDEKNQWMHRVQDIEMDKQFTNAEKNANREPVYWNTSLIKGYKSDMVFLKGKGLNAKWYNSARRVNPAYLAYLLHSMYMNHTFANSINLDGMTTNSLEEFSKRGKHQALTGAIMSVNKTTGFPATMNVISHKTRSYKVGDTVVYKEMGDGQNEITDIAAAWMSIAYGSEYGNVLDGIEGSFKNGGMFIHPVTGQTLYIKGADAINNKDSYMNNPVLLQATEKLYSIGQIYETRKKKTTVWQIYKRNDFDPMATVRELMTLREINIVNGVDLMEHAFVSLITNPTTTKTFRIPDTSYEDIAAGKEFAMIQFPALNYVNLTKLHNKINASITSNNQMINAMMFGENNTMLAADINRLLIRYQQKAIEELNDKTDSQGIGYFWRNHVLSKMHGDGGNMKQFLSDIRNSIDVYSAGVHVKPIMKSYYKDILNPRIDGNRVTQRSSQSMKVWVNHETGRVISEAQAKKSRADLKGYTEQFGLPYMYATSNGKRILGDLEIATMSAAQIRDHLAKFENVKIHGAPVAMKNDFWHEMGYSNNPSSTLYWKKYDVSDMFSVAGIRYDDFGDTPEQRREQLMIAYNSGAIKESHAYIVNEIRSEGEEPSFDDVFNWLEKFNKKLDRIVARTPFSSTASGIKVRIFHFTNESGNDMYISPLFQLIAESDFDGDQLSVFSYDIGSKLNSKQQFNNDLFNIMDNYYNSIDNTAFYLSPIKTDTTLQAVMTVKAALDKIKDINYKRFTESTELTGLYDAVNKFQMYENSNYDNDLIGIIANGIKVYSLLYNTSDGNDFTWLIPSITGIDKTIQFGPEKLYTSFRGVSQSAKIKQGVQELFESNPELAAIGTPEQYSQYLDTIFPDSKVKDIVYHGITGKLKEKFDKFSKEFIKSGQGRYGEDGFFFSENKEEVNKNYNSSGLITAIINLRNTSKDIYKNTWKETVEYLTKPQEIYGGKTDLDYLAEGYRAAAWNKEGNWKKQVEKLKEDGWKIEETPNSFIKLGKISSQEKTYYSHLKKNLEKGTLPFNVNNSVEAIKKAKEQGLDGLVYENILEESSVDKHNQYVVFEPEQIHILLGEEDIKGFKQFVSTHSISLSSDMKADDGSVIIETMADIMQAIVDHAKKLLVQKININPLTINAQIAMITAGVNLDSVSMLFNNDIAKRLLSSIEKTGDIDNTAARMSGYGGMRKHLVLLNQIYESLDRFEDLYNTSADKQHYLTLWNNMIMSFQMRLNYRLPQIVVDEKTGFSTAEFRQQLMDHIRIAEMLKDAFDHGEAFNRAAGVMRLSTKGIPARSFDEYKFFENNLAVINDPQTYSERLSDERKVLSINNYIPLVRNEFKNPDDDIANTNVIYDQDNRSVFLEMNDVAESFINFNKLFAGNNHYFGTEGIMNVIENYRSDAAKLFLENNPMFRKALENSLAKFGYNSVPNSKVWRQILNDLEKYIVGQWLNSDPYNGEDFSYDKMLYGHDSTQPLDLSTQEGRMGFFVQTAEFIDTLKNNPERYFPAETVEKLKNNTWLHEVGTTNFALSDWVQKMETSDVNNPEIASQLGLELINLEAILGVAPGSLQNRMWLYQIMSRGFSINKFDLTKILPSVNVAVLRDYSKFFEDMKMHWYQNADNPAFVDDLNELENAIDNSFAQHIYSIKKYSPVPDTDYNIQTAMEQPGANASRRTINTPFIQPFDKATFTTRFANKTKEAKRRAAKYYYEETLIPLNKEVMLEYYKDDSAKLEWVEKIFSFRDSLNIENLPEIVRISMGYGNGTEAWVMRRNESGIYKRVWSNLSRVVSGYDRNQPAFGEMPSIKPGAKDSYELLRSGSVTLENVRGYEESETLVYDGIPVHITNRTANSITIETYSHRTIKKDESTINFARDLDTAIDNYIAEIKTENDNTEYPDQYQTDISTPEKIFRIRQAVMEQFYNTGDITLAIENHKLLELSKKC